MIRKASDFKNMTSIFNVINFESMVVVIVRGSGSLFGGAFPFTSSVVFPFVAAIASSTCLLVIGIFKIFPFDT